MKKKTYYFTLMIFTNYRLFERDAFYVMLNLHIFFFFLTNRKIMFANLNYKREQDFFFYVQTVYGDN